MRAEQDDLGGTYYLPYRPHASRDQLVRGYSKAAEFVTRKRTVDPGVLLRNHLWDECLAQL